MGCNNASKAKVLVINLSLKLPSLFAEQKRKEREKRKAAQEKSARASTSSQENDNSKKHSTVPKTPLLTTSSVRIKTKPENTDSVSGQSKPADSSAFCPPPKSSVQQKNKGKEKTKPKVNLKQKSIRPSDSAHRPLSTNVKSLSASKDSQVNSTSLNLSGVKSKEDKSDDDDFLSNDARSGDVHKESAEEPPSKASSIHSNADSVFSSPDDSTAPSDGDEPAETT